MPRREHAYHYIYKTTNLINGKFYIGMHSTSNLEDGYIGSGTMLWRSIKKYGIENFSFEILEYYPDRDTLRNREKEIVDETLLDNPQCMNLCKGGWGDKYGLEFPNRKSSPLSEEHKKNISAGNIGKNTGVPKSEEHRQKLAESLRGKHHDEETRKKRGESVKAYWLENPAAEESRKKKHESLKEAWKLRRLKPSKKPVRKKPLSMTLAAIKIRAQRARAAERSQNS